MPGPAHIPPVLGLAAYSGTGKTTLLVQLLPRLKAAGLAVGVIKQSHHDFEIDTPGKDSYRLRKAGADQTLLASGHRWALMGEFAGPHETTLAELLMRLRATSLDLILVEGFRHAAIPKIELHRPATGHPLLHPDDPDVIAVASDAALQTHLPRLDINDADAIAAFVVDWLKQARSG